MVHEDLPGRNLVRDWWVRGLFLNLATPSGDLRQIPTHIYAEAHDSDFKGTSCLQPLP